MILIEKKLGTKKGIPLVMLAASSFDDIIAITVFTIFVSVAFDSIPKVNAVEAAQEVEKLSIKTMIGMNIFYIVVGMISGLLLGYSMSFFNRYTCFSEKCKNWMKFFLMLFIAILAPIGTHFIDFKESAFIGIISFGLGCFKAWGGNKPDKELATFWTFCQPFLFGTIGASV